MLGGVGIQHLLELVFVRGLQFPRPLRRRCAGLPDTVLMLLYERTALRIRFANGDCVLKVDGSAAVENFYAALRVNRNFESGRSLFTNHPA